MFSITKLFCEVVSVGFCIPEILLLQEYEDWDEYEEDGEEQEEEEGGEDEETHQPTQEELDYLSLRQKLKDTIRKQMKKDLGTTNSGSHNKTNAFRKDK